MTTTKSKNGKSATSKKSVRGLLPGRGRPSASSRRPSGSGSGGLRVQATLPGVKRNAKKSGLQEIVAALGKAASRTTPHKPTKSMLGILAGGVGAAAVARRRHDTDQPDLLATNPAQPVQALKATTPGIVETTIEPTSITGGDHGDPQGPDPAAAA